MKQWLINKIIRHLFRGVTIKDLENSFEKLPRAERGNFREQAKLIKELALHDWLHSEMMRVAQKRLYMDAKNEEDMIFAKACMYMEEIREKKLLNLTKVK